MNHDELIKSMKDKGITVKVDNGNKLEFSNGETYVKDSHSDEYKKTKNIMENKMNIRKFVESKLLYENNRQLKEGLPDEVEEKILRIFKLNDVTVKDSYIQSGHFYVETDNTNSLKLGYLLDDLRKLEDSDNIGYEYEENDNGFYARTFEFYDYSEYDESLVKSNDKDESTVKEGRKPIYPVTLEQYIDVLKGQYEKRGWDYDLPENIAKGKYDKACYVYSDIKKNGNWDYRFNRAKWYDSEFGNLKKPEDAFQIDWDM